MAWCGAERPKLFFGLKKNGPMSDIDFKDFDVLSEAEKNEAMALLSRYQRLETQDDCQGDFINFVKHM